MIYNDWPKIKMASTSDWGDFACRCFWLHGELVLEDGIQAINVLLEGRFDGGTLQLECCGHEAGLWCPWLINEQECLGDLELF